MQFLINKQESKELMESASCVHEIMDRITNNMPDDIMKACIASGIPVEVEFNDNTITLKTKYPVSILKTTDGKILDIKYKKI